jgi:tRNA_anti-like
MQLHERRVVLLLATCTLVSLFSSGCGDTAGQKQSQAHVAKTRVEQMKIQADDEKAQASASNAKGATDQVPTIAVSAEQLAKDFKADPTTAQQKYNGKLLVLEGIVRDSFIRDTDGSSRVAMDSTPPVVTIDCYLGKGSDDAAGRLTPGQKVRLKGRCIADQAPAIIFVKECQTADADTDLAISVQAAELAKDFVKDEKAADQKYTSKYLIIEGQVADVQGPMGRRRNPFNVLQGTQDKAGKLLQVAVEAHYDHEKEFRNVQKGKW